MEGLEESGCENKNFGKGRVFQVPNLSSTRGAIKVLVVDDDEWICHYLSKFLIRNGYDVLTALSGQEAIEIANEIQPHIILLDIVMPKMNGIETLRRLRKMGQDCIIIIVTGHVNAKDAREAMDLGAYDYVIKPFNLDSLKTILRQAFDDLSRDGTSVQVGQQKLDDWQSERVMLNGTDEEGKTSVESAAQNRPKRVLLVEADQHPAEDLINLLVSRGFDVLNARNAKRAQELVSQANTRPEVVFLDVHTPDVNGARFCKFIKRNDSLDNIKVVLCSKDESEDLGAFVKAYGADGFVDKSQSYEKWIS
jgi:DNA-binding response OmpR family regulator